MTSFARNDDELALVIAHEMAHNLMKHIEAKKQNAMGGFLADLALAVLTRGAYKDANFANAAGQAYSQEFESEADYVGLYILAKAGLPIDEAPKFWRRMAIAHPANIKTNHLQATPPPQAAWLHSKPLSPRSRQRSQRDNRLSRTSRKGSSHHPRASNQRRNRLLLDWQQRMLRGPLGSYRARFLPPHGLASAEKRTTCAPAKGRASGDWLFIAPAQLLLAFAY